MIPICIIHMLWSMILGWSKALIRKCICNYFCPSFGFRNNILTSLTVSVVLGKISNNLCFMKGLMLMFLVEAHTKKATLRFQVNSPSCYLSLSDFFVEHSCETFISTNHQDQWSITLKNWCIPDESLIVYFLRDEYCFRRQSHWALRPYCMLRFEVS